MTRAAISALFALSAVAGAAAASPALAQQICCVPAPPAPQRADGMRGYAQPAYAAAPAPAYAPNPGYGQPGYGQPYGAPQAGQRYAPPEYPHRPPPAGGLRGYVGIEYGKARLNPGTPSTRVESWTGEAAVVGQVAGFGVQGDIKVADHDVEGGASHTDWSPSLHVFKRNPYGLIGGWAGFSDGSDTSLFGLGVEGQAHMGGASLYGSLGYGHRNETDDKDLLSARLEGRYFVTENFALSAEGGLVRVSDSTGRHTVRSVGLGAEYQPSVLPFSIRANYSHEDVSGSSEEADVIRLGLRWNFDGGSLVEREHMGAALGNVTDLFLGQ